MGLDINRRQFLKAGVIGLGIAAVSPLATIPERSRLPIASAPDAGFLDNISDFHAISRMPGESNEHLRKRLVESTMRRG